MALDSEVLPSLFNKTHYSGSQVGVRKRSKKLRQEIELMANGGP